MGLLDGYWFKRVVVGVAVGAALFLFRETVRTHEKETRLPRGCELVENADQRYYVCPDRSARR